MKQMDVPHGWRPPPGGRETEPVLDLRRYLAKARKHRRLIALVAAPVVLASAVVTWQLPKTYSATSTVMLDVRQPKLMSEQSLAPSLPADGPTIDGEVEVLESPALAARVVKTLQLDHDPEFAGSGDVRWRQEQAVTSLQRHVRIARSGLTYVIGITASSRSADKAAKLANAYAEVYQAFQLETKLDATERASGWLNQRLAGLASQVQAADAAVQQYKAANGLVGLDSSQGATIAQQEISTLNTQLATARAEQAEAEAKLATARRQLAQGSSGDDIGEALNSQLVQDLRKQRAEVSGRVAQLSARYGPRFPELLRVQKQLADIDAEISAEIGRILSNLEAQAQVARQRTASIQESLGHSRGTLAANSTASVRLAELQRNAQSLDTLYQSLLDKYKQVSAQQGTERPDVRIVSPAQPPLKPSAPKPTLNLALGLLLGICAAGVAVVAAELLDRGLYTAEDVEQKLGTAWLSSVPELASVMSRAERRGRGKDPTLSVVANPLSGFAEAFQKLRTLALSTRADRTVRTLAITSALPGEGKTTTALCFARVAAQAGMKTVLVDCDLHRRSLNAAAPESAAGLVEVLSGRAALDEALTLDQETGLTLLPLARTTEMPKQLLGGPAMEKLLEELKRRYQLVILDGAPVLPVADTLAYAPLVDSVLMVAKWRTTPAPAVRAALAQLEAVGAYVAGVVLTQVDVREQVRSGEADPTAYYRLYRGYYAGTASS